MAQHALVEAMIELHPYSSRTGLKYQPRRSPLGWTRLENTGTNPNHHGTLGCTQLHRRVQLKYRDRRRTHLSEEPMSSDDQQSELISEPNSSVRTVRALPGRRLGP